MTNISVVIADNIARIMQETGKNQTELANALSVSKHEAEKIASGAHPLNAPDLIKTADFLNVTISELTTPDPARSYNPVKDFAEKVGTVEGREALMLMDELADLVIFHANVRRNTEAAMRTCRT